MVDTGRVCAHKPRVSGRALLCLMLAGCGVARAAERFDGIARLRGTEQIAYRETDWVYERDGATERLVLYRCPDGIPFARKRVRDVPSAIAPDFSFEDARDGYCEGVRSEAGRRLIFVQARSGAPTDIRPLPSAADAVLDAGFDAFVRTHWQALAAGDAPRIHFLIPSRFEYLDLKVSAPHDTLFDGAPARRLSMRLAAWYGFALPSIEITYDRNGHALREFEGLGTVRDAAGHPENVRIDFPPAHTGA